MELKLNKRGDRRGCHNHQRGAKHSASKGWILYKDGQEAGYFATLREASDFTGVHTWVYLWQMANGKCINKDGQPRKVTSYGWSIKPASVLKTEAI